MSLLPDKNCYNIIHKIDEALNKYIISDGKFRELLALSVYEIDMPIKDIQRRLILPLNYWLSGISCPTENSRRLILMYLKGMIEKSSYYKPHCNKVEHNEY